MTQGIYVHIPYCKSKCGYCSFVSSADLSNSKLYIDELKKEIKERANDALCDSIYVGGGTPSILKRGYITEIIENIRKSFNISRDCEITCEANPDSATKEFAVECKNVGVNRISLGLQSDDDSTLKILNRAHTYLDFIKSLENIKSQGIENISADLIFGIENQKVSDIVKTVNNISLLDLKHISLYALKIEEGTAFYKNDITIDEDLQADMYAACFKELVSKGYKRYEVSNFAVEQKFESRHNKKYWDLSPYIGLGVAAHSYVNGKRIENTNNISKYLIGNHSSNETQISKEKTILEYIMLSLRTSNGIDLNFLKNSLDYDLANVKCNSIKPLLKQNFIEIKDNMLSAKEDAVYLLDSIILKLI